MPDLPDLQPAATVADGAQRMLADLAAAGPVLALTGFVVMLACGLILWLAGRAVARLACVISGLVLGAAAGWLIGGTLAEKATFVLPMAIGMAIIGALLSGLLFRVWIALVGAIVLAAVVPMATLIWQGATITRPAFSPPPLTAPIQPASPPAPAQPGDPPPPPPPGPAQRLNTAMTAMHDQLVADTGTWWQQLGVEGRRVVYIGAAVGLIAGLVLGMVLPEGAAAVQTALAGAMLIYLGATGLARWQFGTEAAFLPDTARGAVVAVGLITVMGTLIQWTIARRQTDK